MTRSRFGGDQPADFMQLAIDGLQARLDGFQTTLDALRRTAEAMLTTHQPPSDGRRPKATLALPEAITIEPKPKPKGNWRGGASWANMTKEQRSTEMFRRMDVARQKREATQKSKNLKASWTPERRAAAAVKARKRWKAGVYAGKTTKPKT